MSTKVNVDGLGAFNVSKKNKTVQRAMDILNKDVLEDISYVDENVVNFKELTDEMVHLYAIKNRDYGGSFDESLDEDGLLVAKIRLKDKLNRFSQLINNEVLVNDESIEDTLIDLANYATMTVKWKREQDRGGK